MRRLLPVLLLLGVLLGAGPVRAEGEITIDVIGRIVHEGRDPHDAVRLAVSTRPEAEFGAKGAVKLGGGQRAGEITIFFKGRRGAGADRADLSLEGEYDVFFGTEQQGVEFSGAFQGAADLAPGEERIVSEMEIAGEGPRRPPTRILIVVRARR